MIVLGILGAGYGIHAAMGREALYLALVSAKPVVWLPGTSGFGGSLMLQLGALGFLVWIVNQVAGKNLPPHPAEGSKFFSTPGLHGSETDYRTSCAAALLRTEPLGVTSELARASRLLGDYFALREDGRA